MDPVPSVCLVQECTILISAYVVEDAGMAPNWLSPIRRVLKEAGTETVSNVLRAYGLVCVTTGLSIII